MTGNAFFDVPVVAHEGVRSRILGTDLAAHVARVASFGPDEPKFLENYKANAPVITFQTEMTLHVGNHTFHMIHMPGHTPYQAASGRRRRRRRFHQRQYFLQGADLAAGSQSRPLAQSAQSHCARCARIRSSPATGRSAISVTSTSKGSFISEWVEYVRGGIGRGMNKEECVANLSALTDRYPMDVGQDGMAPHVMRLNVANLYDYVIGAGIHKPKLNIF